MNIPTDTIVMTIALIAGFIYLKMQKEDTKPKEIQACTNSSFPPFIRSTNCFNRRFGYYPIYICYILILKLF